MYQGRTGVVILIISDNKRERISKLFMFWHTENSTADVNQVIIPSLLNFVSLTIIFSVLSSFFSLTFIVFLSVKYVPFFGF